MASSITANKPIPAPDSVPLLVEPVELEEAPPTCPDDEFLLGHDPMCCFERLESVETPYGNITVFLKGDPKKPVILTYHDVGMNNSSCFNGFMGDENMVELSPMFYWIHITAPGQEPSADSFPEDYVYPDINKLAEQVGLVVEYFQLSHIIGLGVGAGANILTRYAILSPERVRGLVLINLSIDGISWGNLSYYTNKLVGWLLKTNKLQETVEKYFLSHSMISTQSDSDLAATFHHYFQLQNPHNIALFLESYSKRSPISIELLQDLKCQWLLINTTDSEKSQDIIELNSHLGPSKSTLLELYGSGHVLEEHPDKIATSLRLFLQGLGHAVTLGICSPLTSSTDLHLQGVAIERQS